MSAPITLNKPLLICFYGYPGSGKTYVARQLSEIMPVAHLSADRIRSEIFERPTFDQNENKIVTRLMEYMAVEFLRSGMSVAYDANGLRLSQRQALRTLARTNKAAFLLIWLQMDAESAFLRTQRRDRRTSDDRFAMEHSEATFQRVVSGMQNPQSEDYMVISGKHPFITQKATIINRLFSEGLVNSSDLQAAVAKPGLVNIIPNPMKGRVDHGRRNINIQ